MATAVRHRDISDTLLEHSKIEFERGDLLQASEKAWGAVTHLVKAVAHEEGWEDGPHYMVMRNAQRLIGGSPDRIENMKRLALAKTLHVNFYEDDLDRDMVEVGIEGVRMLIGDMKIAAIRLSRRREGSGPTRP